MEMSHYMTCFWPGLPELWWRGRLSALPTAFAFAAAVNLLLVTRVMYPEWFTGVLVKMFVWAGIAVWLFWSIKCIQELPSMLAPRTVSDTPDTFPEARNAYLHGQWAEAEGLLTDLLGIEPRDPPALLLLAGVYRHTDRLEASQTLLDEIKRIEVADRWWLEVQTEEKRLERAISQAKEASENDSPSQSELKSQPEGSAKSNETKVAGAVGNHETPADAQGSDGTAERAGSADLTDDTRAAA